MVMQVCALNAWPREINVVLNLSRRAPQSCPLPAIFLIILS